MMVLAKAVAEARVLLTFDLDFADLVTLAHGRVSEYRPLSAR